MSHALPGLHVETTASLGNLLRELGFHGLRCGACTLIVMICLGAFPGLMANFTS
ncbi:MAG: hypothetical protein WAN11_18980 [Syntrophobacteraceae bacterium]